MTRRKSDAVDDEMRALKLEIERAKLAKLEASLPPPPTPEYTRYEDVPPLTLEERDRFKLELIEALTVNDEQRKKEKHDWYMSMAHLAP